MPKEKPPALKVEAFADHHVITPPNPLCKVMRLVDEKNFEDPVARAEKALAGLSDEFTKWMTIECDRLAAAHAAILKTDYGSRTRRTVSRRARHQG